MIQYEVTCHICGARYAEQDPAVRFILTDHVWECEDASACFDRKATAAHLAELDAIIEQEGL